MIFRKNDCINVEHFNTSLSYIGNQFKVRYSRCKSILQFIANKC